MENESERASAVAQDADARTSAAPQGEGIGAEPGIQVRLHAIVWEADGIATFEFRAPSGEPLPPFRAGAHIDVHIHPGCVRQYSLCNDPAERNRFLVAILREQNGRGGSRAIHEERHVGDLMTIRGPRNHFPLAQSAAGHLLVAGGIGITPMMAMVAELEGSGQSFQLHYCTRSPEKTAFVDRLAPLIAAGKVVLHHDGGDPSRGLDLGALLQKPPEGTHLYYCGPTGFMEATRAASAHWPTGTVHFEYFRPPSDAVTGAAARVDAPFKVKLVRSGLELDVPADKRIIDVLREHDVFFETSCEDGLCGTCLTRYVEGEPEHRDYVLDEGDRKEFVLICCARSKSPVLALDL